MSVPQPERVVKIISWREWCQRLGVKSITTARKRVEGMLAAGQLTRTPVCGKCHRPLPPGTKACQHCGTGVGKGPCYAYSDISDNSTLNTNREYYQYNQKRDKGLSRSLNLTTEPAIVHALNYWGWTVSQVLWAKKDPDRWQLAGAWVRAIAYNPTIRNKGGFVMRCVQRGVMPKLSNGGSKVEEIVSVANNKDKYLQPLIDAGLI